MQIVICKCITWGRALLICHLNPQTREKLVELLRAKSRLLFFSGTHARTRSLTHQHACINARVVCGSYTRGFHNISSSRARWCVRNPVVLTDSITRVLFSLFICSASPHRRARKAYTYNPMFLRRFNQIKPCRRKSAGAPRHAAAVFGRRDAQNVRLDADSWAQHGLTCNEDRCPFRILIRKILSRDHEASSTSRWRGSSII